ncbi:hypothetical protein [Methylobacterium sp. CCH5-D2]|uniref:hypothetical protein n=1 Tax=Methylobacterium sp. CCH5-D2 TaxID=1768765 RepID=UPI0008353C0B|nr:hypothetical protein [Methylobacterium sp. CCH5-D2]
MYNREGVSEFYEIAKTVELYVRVNGVTEHIRIVARDNLRGTFSTVSYIQREIYADLVYPGTGESRVKMMVWADWDLPWTNRDTPEEAINQALSFLWERAERD